MDFIAELGASSLGSRLKRLGDLLYQDYAKLYEVAGVPFKPIWFLILNYLSTRESGSITEIAAALHVTHPYVNQIAGDLIKRNVLEAFADPNDKRRRMLRLTEGGRDLVDRARCVWAAIRRAQEQIIAESESDVLGILARLEEAVYQRGVFERATEGADGTILLEIRGKTTK